MNKLQINTEENQYLLNGKPIDFATEITIRIVPNEIPTAKVKVMCDMDINISECEVSNS